MSLSRETIERLAQHLERCELEFRETALVTNEYPQMDWDDANGIQDEIRRRKIAVGARIVGFKVGQTSRAKMRQMGVETPVFGFLADYFSVPDGGEIDTSSLIHPRIEPEIAFVTKAPLSGPGCDIGAVLAATDFVIPALEIIDSRYRDFKFDLKSVVADNCSASRFVIGGRMGHAAELDLANTGVVLEKMASQLPSVLVRRYSATPPPRWRCWSTY